MSAITIRADVTLVGEKRDEDGWEHREWTVTLHHREGRRMTTKFMTGMALGQPSAEDVLESLLSDAQSAYYDDFEEWADSLGFDSDSRKAERTYRLIEKQTAKLERLLGHGDFYDLDPSDYARKLTRNG